VPVPREQASERVGIRLALFTGTTSLHLYVGAHLDRYLAEHGGRVRWLWHCSLHHAVRGERGGMDERARVTETTKTQDGGRRGVRKCKVAPEPRVA